MTPNRSTVTEDPAAELHRAGAKRIGWGHRSGANNTGHNQRFAPSVSPWVGVMEQIVHGVYMKTYKQSDRAPTATAPKYGKTSHRINPPKTSRMEGNGGGDALKRCSHCNTTVDSLWWKVPPPSPPNVAVLSGRVAKRSASCSTAKLHCIRCHFIGKEQLASVSSGADNNKYKANKTAPLTASDVFLWHIKVHPVHCGPICRRC